MKVLLLIAVTVSLAACSSRGEDSSSPPPATVKMDSSGVTVDTTAR